MMTYGEARAIAARAAEEAGQTGQTWDHQAGSEAFSLLNAVSGPQSDGETVPEWVRERVLEWT